MLSEEEREFVGWFWGEGSLMISKVTSRNSKAKKPYYRPVISITQRDDDAEILEWAKRRFGGTFYKRKHTPLGRNYVAHPRIEWQVIGFKRCRKVLEILKQGLLPSRKKKEIPVFEEFLGTAVGSGKATSPELLEKQRQLFLKLKSLHAYSP